MEVRVLTNKKIEYLSTLNEADARHYVALWAIELGWGGISEVHKLTGKAIDTIRKGIAEINAGKSAKEGGRIRKPGGGRKKIIEKNPDILKYLNRLMDGATAGDPMSSLKWTSTSTYAIAAKLKHHKFNVSYKTVGRLLKQNEYTLQANRKTKAGRFLKERDTQFKYINEQAQKFMLKKQPVISVDTKKKELIGRFKNNGKRWLKKGQPEEVNVYDFPDLATGKVVPYGAYDIALNKGFVNVGISSDTAEFSVESIRQWWKQLGKKHYPKAKKLLITADCGGSNGSRNRGWKYYLQKFSNESRLSITILHFPPGTSKWNKIEHRLFSFISINWRGKPLISYEVVINFIKSTKTTTGLKVYARLDKNTYEKGKKFSEKEMKKLHIKNDLLFPQWNYTITPTI